MGGDTRKGRCISLESAHCPPYAYIVLYRPLLIDFLMRTRAVLLAILTLLLVSCAPAPTDSTDTTDATVATVRIERDSREIASFEAEVAETPVAWGKGLKDRERLDQNAAMLFRFRGMGLQRFWNKDVNFPIDILFADEYGTIVEIAPDVQPCHEEDCPLYGSEDNVAFVLEVNGGLANKFGVTTGDRLASEETIVRYAD